MEMNRDDVERLVRVEAKLQEIHTDVTEIATHVKGKLEKHERAITQLKTSMKIVLGVLTAIGSAIGLPWLSALLKGD